METTQAQSEAQSTVVLNIEEFRVVMQSVSVACCVCCAASVPVQGAVECSGDPASSEKVEGEGDGEESKGSKGEGQEQSSSRHSEAVEEIQGRQEEI